MPIDLLPAGAQILVAPSAPHTLQFDFGAPLAPRTFTAELGGVALSPLVGGDILSVPFTAPADSTAGLQLVVTETTAADRVIFRFPVIVSSAHTRGPDSSSFTITTEEATVTVTVLAGVANADVVPFAPDAGIASTTVQDAIVEAQAGIESVAQPGTWLWRPPLWRQRWAAIAAAAASATKVVDFWGDSTTYGVTPVDNTTTFVTLIESTLQAVYGDGGSGYRPLTRIGTTTGVWTTTGGLLGGCIHQATAAASWEATIDGTEFVIIHDNSGVTGSFRYRVDGGAWITVTTPTGFTINPASVRVAGLSNGTHTLRIEWVSGTVRIAGVEARRSTGVICRMFATGGVRARDYARHVTRNGTASWTSGSSTLTATGTFRFAKSDVGLYIATTEDGMGLGDPSGWRITDTASDGTTATVSKVTTAADAGTILLVVNIPNLQDKPSDTVAPRSGDAFGRHGLGGADLVVISLGLNDMPDASSQSNGAMVRNGISSLIHAYQLWAFTAGYPVPMFAFLIQNKGLARDQGFADAVAAQREMAASVDAAVIDMWQWARHHDASTYSSDGLHPDVSGNVTIRDLAAELLT